MLDSPLDGIAAAGVLAEIFLPEMTTRSTSDQGA